jgi:hypothetical protein
VHELHVHIEIAAPIEDVFALLSDHETFLNTQEGVTAKIIRPGDVERNGLGCVREVRAGRRARYVEEITAWERPTLFEYTIRETSLPLRHLGSRLRLEPRGRVTDVEWTSRFELTVPVVGPLLGWYVKRRLAESFGEFLAAAKKRLEKVA